MTADSTAELAEFLQFANEQLNNGGADLSPEAVLDLWRAAHPTVDELAESVAAISEAIADMEAGDTGTPLEEFDREFRRKNNIPPNA